MTGSAPIVIPLIPRRNLRLWLACAVAVPVIWVWLDPFTEDLRLFLQGLPGIEAVMQTARAFGKFDTQLLILLPSFLIARRLGWRPAGAWLGLTVAVLVLVGVVVSPIKVLVFRERPALTSQKIQADGVLEGVVTGKHCSFPSGDTASAFAAASVLAAFVRRLRVLGYVVACLVAVSRIYFSCHFISDVVAGALLGLLVAALLLAKARQKGWLPAGAGAPTY